MASLINQIQMRGAGEEDEESRELISKLPPANLRIADLVLETLYNRWIVVQCSLQYFTV